ncbi:MAG: type I polyketide synthase, partial [Planctomycetota bacterium]
AARGAPRQATESYKFIPAVSELTWSGIDAGFFGFTSREVELLHPQQQLFIQCAWEALEDAGYSSDESADVGVFAATGGDYRPHSSESIDDPAEAYQRRIRSEKDFVTSWTAYKLNLTGPAVSIQTACSSVLVAVHYACQSLLLNECNLALVGGANLISPPSYGYYPQEGMIYSADGHCRPFDAKASGTVLASGGGAVILKRLSDARQDGDHIYSIIKGTAVSNDGSSKPGFTAPSMEGQAQTIVRALSVSGVSADSIDYVEAHGTGTVLGDPIEVAALTLAFQARSERDCHCALGSVKSNIGHLDSAAGIASLIKTALSIHHGRIPAMANFEQLNPKIRMGETPFYVNSQPMDWPQNDRPRRAGVSGFGIGGTNAHVILEQAPTPATPCDKSGAALLIFSAKSQEGLRTIEEQFVDWHDRQERFGSDAATLNSKLHNAAFSLQVGRSKKPFRSSYVCKNWRDIRNRLQETPKHPASDFSTSDPDSIVFAFPGQGVEYSAMGKELAACYSEFRYWMDRCDEILQDHCGFELKRAMGWSEDSAPDSLATTDLVQPSLFAFEYSLAKLWMSWGLTPNAVVGHSLGEYVAACVAGVMPLEQAICLVFQRGQLMEHRLGHGKMLAIFSTVETITSILPEELSLAAVNSPSQCVVSGSPQRVDQFQSKLSTLGIRFHPLRSRRAFHSSMMDPMLEEFRAYLRQVPMARPVIKLASNLTGHWAEPDTYTADYWLQHTRHTIQYERCIRTIRTLPDICVLETGPGATLSNLSENDNCFFIEPSLLLKTTETESETILATMGRLWERGIEFDWKAVSRDCSRISLPTYPFKHTCNKLHLKRNGHTNEMHHQKPDINHIDSQLQKIFGQLIGQEPDAVDTQQPFLEMGVDSLSLAQAKQQIERQFGVSIPTSELMSSLDSVTLLAQHIVAIPNAGGSMPNSPLALKPPPNKPQGTDQNQVVSPADVLCVAPTSITSLFEKQIELLHEQIRTLQQYRKGIVAPTSGQAHAIFESETENEAGIAPTLCPIEREAALPLTEIQQLVWFGLIAGDDIFLAHNQSSA